MNCCKPYPARYIPYFEGFTEFTPSIPKMYWDVKSQEQRIKAICEQFHKMICYANMLGNKLNDSLADIDELTEMFNKFIESGFDDYYAKQVEKWIDSHLQFIYEKTIRQVYFGLTLDGYFVAYIPDSWSDIVFDTGMNYQLDTYGRLILRWDADSPYDLVDQSPEIVRPYDEAYLREQITNIMNTLYSTGGESNNGN